MEIPQTHLKYRADIDGLRAVAVLAVVFYHAGLGFPGGYTGVDIFFVISGYLITSIILRDTRKGTFSLLKFWERRIRRIVPALAVVAAFVAVVGWFVMMPHDYAEVGTSLVALTLLISNINFWQGTDYFDGAAEEMPLLHTWSLAVEEQFYLFVPLLLLVLAKYRREWLVLAILTAVTLVSLVLSIYGALHHPVATFYLLPTRAWELLAGSLLAFVPMSGKRPITLARQAGAVLGVLMIGVPFFIYTAETPFPGMTAVPSVLGTVLLIWSGTNDGGRTLLQKALEWRPMVFVGLISYSLYLWHWPLIAFARYATIELTFWASFLLIAASFAFAVASWKWVELPFRETRNKISGPRLVYVGGPLASIAALLVVGIMLWLSGGVPSRLSPVAANFAAAGEADRDYIFEVEIADIADNFPRFGEQNGSADILVWGDSHAMALLPAIKAVAKNNELGLVVATRSSTPPAINYVPPRGLKKQAPAFNAGVLDYVWEQEIRAVVLAAYWESHLRNPVFVKQLAATVLELKNAGLDVYLVKDVPKFTVDVPKRYFVRELVGLRQSAGLQSLEQYREFGRDEDRIFGEMENYGVHVLDPEGFFLSQSDPNTISTADRGGLFYRDTDHLTTYGALRLAPLFEDLAIKVAQRKAADADDASVVRYEFEDEARP